MHLVFNILLILYDSFPIDPSLLTIRRRNAVVFADDVLKQMIHTYFLIYATGTKVDWVIVMPFDIRAYINILPSFSILDMQYYM